MKFARLLTDTRGATALEFALTAPAFFMLVFGILDFGILAYSQVALQHGVEAAARCATINSTSCGTTSAIQSYAVEQSLGLSPPSSTFSVSTPACGTKIDASYNFSPDFGYFGATSITLSASSCFPK